ncbi:MAG: extracellular solute-binding protein, partial [Anaerolineae bacterium]|nr:extracellular solute-binding protein [Anaerolineae bacterium]
MKKYAMALGLILLTLTLSTCAQSGQQSVEVTRVVVETREVPVEVTRESTREVTREVTREAEDEVKPVQVVVWTSETEADGGLRFVESLADDYTSFNPEITFEIVDKDAQVLRDDFLTADLTSDGPDLLWTVHGHASPLAEAQRIMPVDDLFELRKYVDPAQKALELEGHSWGVPVSLGDHLMLIYNKDLVEEPPGNTDELIEMGQELTAGDQFALVYNQTDPWWLVPWLGGFNGSVFAEDGRTPTLNTPKMVKALQFLQDLVYQSAIVPPGTDYDGSFVLFNQGRAAMIIDGEWTLSPP